MTPAPLPIPLLPALLVLLVPLDAASSKTKRTTATYAQPPHEPP